MAGGVVKKEFRVLSDFFYYFAFGSNLLEERIHVQVKGAEFQGVGRLRGYSLKFFDHGSRWQGAVASVEQAPAEQAATAEVVGCVWRVPNSFAEELDEQESGYHRLVVPVQLLADNETVQCRTYQYSNPERRELPPSPHYKRVIVEGARQHRLPADYIRRLEALPTNDFRGRVLLDLDVLKELNDAAVPEPTS